jgi:AcrR family transcriptional regulator
MRALTREAGVNLAAVNYHFGSKLELLRGALSRHLEAVNAERLRILDKLEAQGPRALSVEAVLDALFRPCVEFTHISARHAARIRGVIALVFREPPELIRPLIDELFHAVHERFVAALARQLPELPLELVELRVQLGIGSMIHLIANRAPPIIRLDESRSTDELVAFVAGALRAPALPSPKKDGLR